MPFDFDMRRPAASLQVQISRQLMKKKESSGRTGEKKKQKKTTHAKKISLPSPRKPLKPTTRFYAKRWRLGERTQTKQGKKGRFFWRLSVDKDAGLSHADSS